MSRCGLFCLKSSRHPRTDYLFEFWDLNPVSLNTARVFYFKNIPIFVIQTLSMDIISIKEGLHKNYLKQKGRFVIDCNTIIFSIEEIEILNKYGHWFRAICNGELEIFTEKQRRFVQAIEGEREPFSPEEVAWHKYLGRKKVEEKYGDKLEYDYMPEENGFYSREMHKTQQLLMFRLISDEHLSK